MPLYKACLCNTQPNTVPVERESVSMSLWNVCRQPSVAKDAIEREEVRARPRQDACTHFSGWGRLAFITVHRPIFRALLHPLHLKHAHPQASGENQWPPDLPPLSPKSACLSSS